MDVGGGEVLREMNARAGSGDQQHVRGEVEQPGEGDLGRGGVQPGRQRGEYGAGEQVVVNITGPAQRAEGNEGDAASGAFGQNIGRSLVGQVEQVLNADDLGLVDGSQQLFPGDVAESDAA